MEIKKQKVNLNALSETVIDLVMDYTSVEDVCQTCELSAFVDIQDYKELKQKVNDFLKKLVLEEKK